MQPFTARFWHVKRLYDGWLVRVAGGVWFLLGALTFVRDNLLPPDRRAHWDTYVLVPHPGPTTWVLISLGVLLLGAIEGSYRLERQREEELARFAEDSPRIEAEITQYGGLDVPHQLGHSARMWGLRLRNVGATAEFQVFVEVKTPDTPASDGKRRRVSFVGETARGTRIVNGGEETVYFAMTDTIELYKEATVTKALVYFDERKKEDCDMWLVPTVEAAVGFGPLRLEVDYEVTVVSDPPMAAEWKRTYRLGPGNEMHDVTPSLSAVEIGRPPVKLSTEGPSRRWLGKLAPLLSRSSR